MFDLLWNLFTGGTKPDSVGGIGGSGLANG